nr:hypothetical protein [Tanacetum cinerariifolium]
MTNTSLNLRLTDSPLLGVSTPRSDVDRFKLMELMVFLMKNGVCDEFGLNAARLSKFLLSGKCDVTRLQALVDKKRIVITEEQVLDTYSAFVLRVEGLENANAAQQLEIVKLKAKGRNIVDMDQDEGIELVTDQEKDAEVEGRYADKHAEIYNIDLDHSSKVLSMQEDDSEVAAASTPIPAVKPKTLTIAAALTVLTRKRKGVVIRDPEEDLPSNTLVETHKVKDKGKGILIEAPKPIKKKDQIEMDVEYARKLQDQINKEHEEAYKNID